MKNKPPKAKKISLPSKEVFIDLYKVMQQIRQTELKIAEIYPSDKIQSPVHLSIGQEAVSAGVCRALKITDHLYGTYRSHGIYIAKGGDLNAMFAELFGKDPGCARGKGGSMHLVAPEVGLIACSAIVASVIPVATGDALAAKVKREKRAVVSFFGDGAVDEGVFYESVNFAVLKKLPVLYVLENNQYAIHSKVKDRHGQTDLYRLTEGLGLPGTRYDGNDVAAVYGATLSAVERIKKGSGPVLLEFATYRMREHVGIASDIGEEYRISGENKIAVQNDPIKKAEAILKKKFKVKDSDLKSWQEQVARDVESAVQFAENAAPPVPEQLYDFVYAE